MLMSVPLPLRMLLCHSWTARIYCTPGMPWFVEDADCLRTRRSVCLTSQPKFVTKEMILSDNLQTYQKEGLLNRRLVVHGSEIVFFDSEDHKLFEKSIAHHKLLAGTWDVPVVMEEPHSGVSGDVSLQHNVVCQIHICLCCFWRPHSEALSWTWEVVEPFVSDFVDHYWYQ